MSKPVSRRTAVTPEEMRREALNTALEKFKGTLVFVSHDREFVSSLATRVLEIRTDGTLVNYLGTYEEYLASQGIE